MPLLLGFHGIPATFTLCVQGACGLAGAGQLVPAWREAKRGLVSVCLPACPLRLPQPAHWQLHQARLSACNGLFRVLIQVLLAHATSLPQGPSVNEIKCNLLVGVSGLLWLTGDSWLDSYVSGP